MRVKSTSDDFVTQDQALILKKIGFDWETLKYYATYSEGLIDGPWTNNASDDEYSAPTIYQTLKWLREKFLFFIHVRPCVWHKENIVYDVYWVWVADEFKDDRLNNFATYEDALSAGINEALKLLYKKMKFNFFTTPVYIKSNNPSLRAKLMDLGYVNRNKEDYLGNCICTFPYPDLCHTNAEYMCFDIDNDFKQVIAPSIGYIECTNEKMFIAIAALRNDSDYKQWFTDGHDWKINMSDKWEDGDSGLGLENNTDMVQEYYPEDYHKATVEELIEHFKRYD